MSMTNQDVKEIVRLEGRATLAERASSGDRWHAAHLISAQLARKTYRQLSQEIVSAGGKGSIGHLERMAKCWKLVGRVQYETHKEDWARYPNFTTVYQSDEVRGTAEESSGSPAHIGMASGLSPPKMACRLLRKADSPAKTIITVLGNAPDLPS